MLGLSIQLNLLSPLGPFVAADSTTSFVDADVKLNWISITFVFISYLGTWIAPAAAPARVALGIIAILTVSGCA